MVLPLLMGGIIRAHGMPLLLVLSGISLTPFWVGGQTWFVVKATTPAPTRPMMPVAWVQLLGSTGNPRTLSTMWPTMATSIVKMKTYSRYSAIRLRTLMFSFAFWKTPLLCDMLALSIDIEKVQLTPIFIISYKKVCVKSSPEFGQRLNSQSKTAPLDGF